MHNTTIMAHVDNDSEATMVCEWGCGGSHQRDSTDYPVVKMGTITVFPTVEQIAKLHAAMTEFLAAAKVAA